MVAYMTLRKISQSAKKKIVFELQVDAEMQELKERLLK